MLRRSIIELASRSSVCRVPLQTTTQIPAYLSSRRAFSASQKNEPPKPDSSSSAPESQSHLPKIITGGFVLGSVFLASYYYGFLDKYLGKEQQRIDGYAKAPMDYYKNTQTLPEQKANHLASELSKTIAGSTSQESDISSSDADTKEDIETHPGVSVPEDSIKIEEDEKIQAEDIEVLTPGKADHVEGRDLPNVPESNISPHDVTSKTADENLDLKSTEVKPDENLEPKSPVVKPDEEQYKAIETSPTFSSVDRTPFENETNSVPTEQTTSQDMQKGHETQKSSSLLDDYNITDNAEEMPSSDKHTDISSTIENNYDGYVTKDGKLVLEFLQAIHAAEERQAELDARFFAQEKRAMKEKYEKELKDARVRELMYAEREAILDKELNKERVKAAAALKSLEEKLEEKLKTELEQKETEVEQTLKKIQDIAKAELAAAIASEKASQIEKMAEANIHINALCMAFYARSEEALQSHSVHKLAVGVLALEDALSKGLPIKKEVEAFHTHVEGIEKDSLVSLVVSSLPEDTLKNGTDTPSQLNHKFDALKGTLRHFSLIPPGGGGILAHSLAHIASWLKVKEADQSGDGIESLMNKVESLLAQGKLYEAADTLENGVKDSQAAEVVHEWVSRARNRAISEQALTVLQAYATSISLT